MAATDKARLEPCPFCGASVQAVPIEGAVYSLVNCGTKQCPASEISCYPEQWNTRAQSTAVDALADAASDAMKAFRYLRDNHLQLWSDAVNPDIANTWDKLRAALKAVEELRKGEQVSGG